MATPPKPTTVGDVDHVGSHCQFAYCNQLDFLPFVCPSCKETFCSDHRTESAHSCTSAGAWAERKRQAELERVAIGSNRPVRDRISQKDCAADSCKTVIGTSLVPAVHCARCNRDYCLKHRLEDEHDCKSKIPIGARPTAAGALNGAKSAFERLRLWGNAKKEAAAARVLPKPKPSTAAQRAVAVNTIKKTAKGDEKLPPQKRVYLVVEAEGKPESAWGENPKGCFFYSQDWVVGRVMDAAAKSLKVDNLNNQSTDKKVKLKVFHVEGGRILDFKEKIGEAVVSGNTLVLLRGMDEPEDLIEM
ncbi:putative an1-type zinc finger protein 1 [Podospora conica]|nr:putative an1-type zinc finger protein 1 [Schizothecium conicum]